MKYLFKILVCFQVFLGCQLTFADSGSAVETGKTMGIFETVGLPEDAFLQSFTGSLGKTKLSKEGALLTKADSTFDPYYATCGLNPIPYVYYNALLPQTQSAMLANAIATQSGQVNMLITKLKSCMVTSGAVESVFYYRQTVRVKGNASKKSIIWNLVIDAQGRARYSDAKIIDDVPQYVHLTYTPYKVAAGLPATWSYPSAGFYTWEIVNQSFSPISTTTTVDVLGVYDEPVAQTVKPYTLPYPKGCSIEATSPFDMVCDPEWGLKCLIDKASDAGCPVAYKDIKTLIDDTGSTGAYVDYVRTLSPVYDQVLTGYDVLGQAVYEDRARVSVSVDARQWIKGKKVFFISSGGGAKYRNVTRVGYELNKQVDRYQVNSADLSYTQIGSKTTQTLSPTTTVDKTVLLAKTDKCTNFGNLIIDPFATSQVYNWTNDTLNGISPLRYIYVAPLNCY